MANMDIVRARLVEIQTELRSIHEGAGDRALNTDEQTRWENLETEERDSNKALTDHEAEVARAAKVAESRARWNSVQVLPTGKRDPFEGIESLRMMSDEDARARALTAIGDVSYRGLRISDEARQSATRMVESVDGAAAYVLAHGSPAYMSAFRSWLTSGGMPVYTAEEAAAVRASLSLTSANGGYALPTLLDPTLIHTGAVVKNPMRRISTVKTGTQNVWHGVTAGAVTTAWKGEGAAFTDGTPTVGEVSVTAAALTAYVTGSYEIFADSNLLADLPGLIGEAIDYAEQDAFVVGSGSTAPTGIITAISATAASTVTATTRGSFTSASAVDVLALLNAVPTRFEDSSTWLMNKATYLTIEQQIIGTAGIRVAVDMAERGELLGSPVARASSMTATTTSGNVLAVLGDFSRFIIYDRLGMSLDFVQNVVNGDGTPIGKRGLLAYKRVGSNTVDVNAFRFLKA